MSRPKLRFGPFSPLESALESESGAGLKESVEIQPKVTTTRQDALSFFSLPREMRDCIYSFAYGPQGGSTFRILTKRAWKANEKHRRYLEKKTFAPTAMSACPLNDLIVSRQFYAEAVDIWFRDRTFAVDDIILLSKPSDQLPALIRSKVRHVRLRWYFESTPSGAFCTLQTWSSIRVITLRVDGGAFDNILQEDRDKLCCVDVLGVDDFKRLPSVRAITGMKTLNAVKLEPGTCHNANTSEELQQFKDNVASLERYIASEIALAAEYRKKEAEAEAEALLLKQQQARAVEDVGKGVSEGTQKGVLDVYCLYPLFFPEPAGSKPTDAHSQAQDRGGKMSKEVSKAVQMTTAGADDQELDREGAERETLAVNGHSRVSTDDVKNEQASPTPASAIEKRSRPITDGPEKAKAVKGSACQYCEEQTRQKGRDSGKANVAERPSLRDPSKSIGRDYNTVGSPNSPLQHQQHAHVA